MSKLEFDREIRPATKFAEGFLNGIKLAVCHALTYGIYYSKEDSLQKGTTFKAEYVKHLGKSTFFYTLLMGGTYG